MNIIQQIRIRLEASNLIDIFQLVWASSSRWTIACFVLVSAQSIFPVSILYITKLILDTVTTGLESGADFNTLFNQALVWVVLLAILSILSITISALFEYAFTSLSYYVTDHVYQILQKKAAEVDLESYETPTYYDLLYRAAREISSRPATIVKGMMNLGKYGLSLIGVGVLLVSLDPLIAVFLIIAGFPNIIARFIYSRQFYDWHRQQANTARQISYYNSILTDQFFAKENRLFNSSSHFLNKSIDLRNTLRTEELRLTARFQLFGIAAQSVSTITVYILLALVVHRTLSGLITIGDLVMYYEGFRRAQGFLGSFLGEIANIYQNSLFIANLYEFLALKPKIVDPENPKPFPQPMQQGIVVNNVSFDYPASTREALKGINLTIRPGETIAIVGENGSGKTTLIKLLCRLYEPTCGNITIDGMNLSDFKVNDLREQISVVFQDYVKYHMTARENIWLGKVDTPLESDKIIAAAKYSGADAVISKLSDGYDTVLGKLLQDGEELSIGEWQKIAIARAYLRDSQIIILDEPTSALDAHSEFEVFEKFTELAKDKAAILISHRLSTIKMADCIYYMNDGVIVESGTHEELIRKQGLYAGMFNIQAQNYREL